MSTRTDPLAGANRRPTTESPIAAIRAALAVFMSPGQVVELRALDWGFRHAVAAGYYDDPAALARDAAKLTREASGVYVTLNPVNPALLARCANRWEEQGRKATLTGDKDIIRRRLFLVDTDPVRPAGISASEAEHIAALARSQQIAAALQADGWPAPARADSGNGGHLLWRVDLPADDGGLLERCLKALALRWDGVVTVDVGNGNAARICKLYGTQARKGDNVPDRPHRWARLIDRPVEWVPVPLPLLEVLAARCPVEPPRPTYTGRGAERPWDIPTVIAEHHLEVLKEGGWNGGYKWVITCPWDNSHTDESAYILQFASGAVAAGCQHNSCQGQDWTSLKRTLGIARAPHSTPPPPLHPTLVAAPAPARLATNGQHPPTKGAPPADPPDPAPDSAAATDTPSDLLTAAEYWAAEYGGDWGYSLTTGQWHHWEGTHWQPLAAYHPYLDEQATTVLRALGMKITSMSRVDGVIRFARRACLRTFPSPTGLVNFANGTLEAAARPDPVLRPPDRADGLTYCLPYEWAPGPHPQIDRFLTETIPDSTARTAYLSHLGLALLGDTHLHYMVLLLGPTRSGKTTLLHLGNVLCGQPAAGFAGAELFDRQSEGLRSRVVWNTKRLVAIDELPVEALRNEELVKQMTAHSGVAMRGLHQAEQTENQWRPKLLLCTNEAPRYSDRSGALSERLIPIRCPHTRPPARRNKYLLQRLLPELPALAATCLQLALPLLRDPYATYPISATMRQDLNEIEQDGDTLKSFVAEECVREVGAWVPSADLYAAYRQYCFDNGNAVLSQKKLAGSLKARWGINATGPTRYTDSGGHTHVARGLEGIRLRAPDEPESEPPLPPEDADLLVVVTDVTDVTLSPISSIGSSLSPIEEIDQPVTSVTSVTNPPFAPTATNP